MVKNLPAMQETWVSSLGQEDPLEKGMATHSSVLAWRIPWTEEPGGLQSMGSHRVGRDWPSTLPLLLTVFSAVPATVGCKRRKEMYSFLDAALSEVTCY